MSESRRLWFPFDALFPEQEIVEALQREHGAAGPWTFVWLLCEAYKRHFHLERPSGIVNMSYRRLAEKAGVEDAFGAPDRIVRDVMRNLRDARILEFIEGDLESATFRVRFSKWGDWLPSKFTDPTATERKRRQRATNPLKSEMSRSVTLSHAKGDVDRDVVGDANATPPVRPEVARLSHLLGDLILKRDPKAKVTPEAKRWLDAIRLLLDTDKRSEADVEHVIRWCQEDKFWKDVILSAPKLREKFTQLYMKAGKPKGTADDFFKRNGM